MKTAIYNPYLDTLGGGERYSMVVAVSLVNAGYAVEVEWGGELIKEKLESRFGMSLEGVKFVKDVKRGDGYDVCFWVSDGSIPALKARKNFLHFQFPFKNISGKSLLNRMKLMRIDKIICNSKFTKRFIDKEYGVDSVVIYPPVDVGKIKSKRKEDLIVGIGRFSQLTQSKRQDVLVEAFKKFFDSGMKDWKMILAGGAEVGAGNYLKKLKRVSEGYPIQIKESPSFKEILDLYARAKIFWSASGFGVDEEKEPIKVEHFGISTVEAMAAGCVPMVYNAGGHKETVDQQKNGFLWNTRAELVKFSKSIDKNSVLTRSISRAAKETSQRFSNERFTKEFTSLL